MAVEIKLIINAIMVADVTVIFFLSISLVWSYLAQSFAVTSGSPLATNVIKIPITEADIWYKPKPSAPSFRDKNMRKIKPNIRVITENMVIIDTVLNTDFTSLIHLLFLQLCI